MDHGQDDYTTTAQVAIYLDRALTSNEEVALGYVITAVSRWIDRTLNTCFDNLDLTSGVSARYFKGGRNNVNIDHCQNVTLVQAVNAYDNSIFYTYSTPLEYLAQPYNLPIKTYLTMRRNEFSDGFKFPAGENSILVTALFTEYDYINDQIPPDIQLLVNHVCGVWLQNAQNADNVLKEEIEGHLIQKSVIDIMDNDPMVTRVIDSRIEIWLDE